MGRHTLIGGIMGRAILLSALTLWGNAKDKFLDEEDKVLQQKEEKVND